MTVKTEITQNILDQIGGARALYMIGTKQVIQLEDGVRIRFTGSRKVNLIRIYLNGMDLYNIDFERVRAGTVKRVEHFKNIYADQLKGLIEETTGLYLKL